MIQSYKHDVVDAVRALTEQYMDDCVSLTQVILPRLAATLLRQRGAAYYIAGEGDHEESVFNQALHGNIDNVPVNNLEM